MEYVVEGITLVAEMETKVSHFYHALRITVVQMSQSQGLVRTTRHVTTTVMESFVGNVTRVSLKASSSLNVFPTLNALMNYKSTFG